MSLSSAVNERVGDVGGMEDTPSLSGLFSCGEAGWCRGVVDGEVYGGVSTGRKGGMRVVLMTFPLALWRGKFAEAANRE